MRALALAAALALPGLAAAQLVGGRARVAIPAEATLSRWPQSPELAAGYALAARIGWAEVVYAQDWATRAPVGVAGLGTTWLAGAGVAADASPLVSLHAEAVGGVYTALLRDYVYGGWREVSGPAWGGRATVRLHPALQVPRGARVGLWPIASLSLTVLRVAPDSDRLRGVRWGGATAVLTLSLGAELTAPRRHPRPEP